MRRECHGKKDSHRLVTASNFALFYSKKVPAQHSKHVSTGSYAEPPPFHYRTESSVVKRPVTVLLPRQPFSTGEIRASRYDKSL